MRLKRISIEGFRSIRSLNELELGSLNVLIGANGSGKSNLVQLFRMLSAMAETPDGLTDWIALHGFANANLFDGAQTTPELKLAVDFASAQAGECQYFIRLAQAAGDCLVFRDERMSSREHELSNWTGLLTADRRHSGLHDELLDPRANTILASLKGCRSYQFHNTSEKAPLRQARHQDDNAVLMADGANLAPYLLRLANDYPHSYKRITETLRQAAPFFANFLLEPQNGMVALRWRETGSDTVFHVSQMSDGTLRTVALLTLLLQPAELQPPVMILDEPELGLHPYAIDTLGGLLRSASIERQIIVLTQSPELLNHFEPEEVITVERHGRESVFRRLDTADLAGWLDAYSLSDLWLKNVLGGRPTR